MLTVARYPFVTFGVVLVLTGIARIVRPRGLLNKNRPMRLNPPPGTFQLPPVQPGQEGRVRVLGALAVAAGVALLIAGIVKLG